MKFHKYHALGNDYIVMDPLESAATFTTEQVVRICHRNFGVGSDGILLGPLGAEGDAFGLKIYNPDGSIAEKSGNGLRIFSRFLFDTGRVKHDPFRIKTDGGMVESTVHGGGDQVTVEMGRVSFDAAAIPVPSVSGEVLKQTLTLNGETLIYSAATIGNPHCVLLTDVPNEAEARRLGPGLETHPNFPHRTNVQFLKVLDRANLQIEIWERGAGYTLASGSSSSAAAAVARRLGLVDANVTVHMPGGTLTIAIADDYAITMTGPVTRVADGEIFGEMFK